MVNRGRLGLLADGELELEIDDLCTGWLLPPSVSEGDNDDDDDEEPNQDDITVQHIEWIEESFDTTYQDGHSPLVPLSDWDVVSAQTTMWLSCTCEPVRDRHQRQRQRQPYLVRLRLDLTRKMTEMRSRK